MDGLIVLDKPPGITSAGAVNQVKRLLERGTKIGHAGTLDPFATGVLLLLVGKATRVSERLMDHPKNYEARIKFGAFTATDDLDSPEILPEIRLPEAGRPGLEEIKSVVVKFIGNIFQRPPVYSALKISGRAAYKRARSGEIFELKPRQVRIDKIEIVSWEWPLLKVRVDCGRGTYIRALARDLGEALKIGGYLTELRRTRVGEFDVGQAVTLERLLDEGVAKHLRGIPL